MQFTAVAYSSYLFRSIVAPSERDGEYGGGGDFFFNNLYLNNMVHYTYTSQYFAQHLIHKLH